MTSVQSSERPSRHRRFWARWLPILSLWAPVLVFTWRIGLAGRVLAGGDVFSYFYGYWAEATRALRGGRLPLWNPYVFMGSPFLANSQVGFFYPLNWVLWLLAPAHRSLHLSIVLHLGLAATTAYAWARHSLRLSRIGAWTAGAIFALGGYLGAQMEHVNQLQALAWMPLLLVLYDLSAAAGSTRRRRLAAPMLALVIALVILIGHTQTAFIALLGLALYALAPAGARAWRERAWRPLMRPMVVLAAVMAVAVLLAAIQLVPTGELTRHSIRARGLPFRERVSFSLTPFYLTRGLLPRFTDPVEPAHVEHVAYVGMAGLALAALPLLRRDRPWRVIILVGVGLFLSLGAYNPLYWLLARYVPGFAHFRVPARWLALYVLGMAALAGRGIDHLIRQGRSISRRQWIGLGLIVLLMMGWAVLGPRMGEGGEIALRTAIGWTVAAGLALTFLLVANRWPRAAAGATLALLLIELYLAGGTLPHNRATAPQAFTSLRPAIAHMLATSDETGVRFLSMSDITFDPGDLAEMEVIYGPQLSDPALYELIVASKQKEVLSPNLPLAFGVSSVDGYDGGVLPLARYVALQRLFLPAEQVSMDGRLRENLSAVPEGRWLDLFNVRYVITDKLGDAWVDDVFYDLQFGARLSRGERAEVAHVPAFEATALGLVSHLGPKAGTLEDGAVVGRVSVGFDDGRAREFALRAGEGIWPAGQGTGALRLSWSEPSVPVTVAVEGALETGEWVVRGASLIDERTGSFQALVLSDEGRFRLVHSGDVKIYENLNVLPRAFFVGRTNVIPHDDEALRAMRHPSFDPAAEAVVDAGRAYDERVVDATVEIVDYGPARVEIAVGADTAGTLILTDAWYPGWRASVDGRPAPIRRANVYFRAVELEPGTHRVFFAYAPASLRIGAAISLVAAMGLAGALSKAWRGDIIDQANHKS